MCAFGAGPTRGSRKFDVAQKQIVLPSLGVCPAASCGLAAPVQLRRGKETQSFELSNASFHLSTADSVCGHSEASVFRSAAPLR